MSKRGLDGKSIAKRNKLRRKGISLKMINDKHDKKDKRMNDQMAIEGEEPRKLVHRSKSKIRSLSRARSKGSKPKGRGDNMLQDKLRNKDRR